MTTDQVFGAPRDDDSQYVNAQYVEPTDAPTERTSLLDRFKSAAVKEIHNVVIYPIEHRGDMYARFDAVIELDDVKKYRKFAMGAKKRPEDMDMVIANGMALVEKNTGLYDGGYDDDHQVMATDGQPLTFGHREFLDLYPSRIHAADAVRQFLGGAQLANMGDKLYAAAGYGKDLEPVDPTID